MQQCGIYPDCVVTLGQCSGAEDLRECMGVAIHINELQADKFTPHQA